MIVRRTAGQPAAAEPRAERGCYSEVAQVPLPSNHKPVLREMREFLPRESLLPKLMCALRAIPSSRVDPTR